MTIKEVAKSSGVSTATVSRVLNGNYPVAESTRKRVMDAVKAVGYRPNALAKSLKTNKTYTVGLIVPDISNVYFMNIAKGVESVISPYGYTLALGSSDEVEDKEIKLLQTFRDRRFDYCILASCLKDFSKLNAIIDDDFSIIMVDTYDEKMDLNFVLEENEKYSYMLTKYCIDMGHKDIAIVGGIEHISTAVERYDGFKKALSDAGIEFKEEYYIDGGYDIDIAYKSVKMFLEKHSPTLIYATNNRMAEGAMLAIKERGLKIPDDISLVSYGDVELGRLIEPKLTIINQNSYSMGVKAGEIIIKSSDKINTYKIKSEMILRNSVKKLKGESKC